MRILPTLLTLLIAAPLHADPPVAAYLFPAGGQRGTTVAVRAGGLYLYDRCSWELLGPGVKAASPLRRVATRWFEGPMLPLPDSQRIEDYPQDLTADIRIATDAPLGHRRARLWTSEGAAEFPAFVVGELPEVVEQEIDGDPVPVAVQLPVTINGRIFPRENVDVWTFAARKGQVVTCEAHAARIGSPLDTRLEVRGPDGRVLAENDDFRGTDSLVSFLVPGDGTYQVRIHDTTRAGSQRHVYRLTITTDPVVHHVYPLGGRRGDRGRFTLTGVGLPRDPVEVALPATPGKHQVRLPCAGKSTAPVLLDVDELPEVLEAEPNDRDEQAGKVAWPAVLNGRMDRPGDVDVWRLTAKKGEVIELHLRSRELGSSLDGLVEIADAAGKVLRQLEGEGPHYLPIPSDGDYLLRVRDRFRSRGGPAFGYRLRIARQEPDFRLELTTPVQTVHRGSKSTARLGLRVLRLGGFNGPITLTAAGLPAGVLAGPLILSPGQPLTNLPITAADNATIGLSRIRCQGTATIAGRTVTRTATLTGEAATQDVLLAVALKAPFKIFGEYDLRIAPRGSVFRKRFRIERNGYAGPLVVRLADSQARHLQGVTGPVLNVPAGADSFEYPVTLPPWMEIGRTSRACVMAIGTVREGDVEHTVSYTSQAQNDQMIAVVETGRLGLELGRASVAASPGKTVGLPVSVRRGKGLSGAVKVELVAAEHVRGLSARAMTLTGEQTGGVLPLTFDQKYGPFNLPVVVRATLLSGEGAVTAEGRLEVVAGE